MIALRPYIIYTLPQSKTTQKLTGGKIEKVWKNLEHFIIHCTSADLDNPKSIELTAYTAAEDHGEEPEKAEQLLKQAKLVFGPGNTKPIGFLYPANTPLKQTKTEWSLKADELHKALKFIISKQPLPKYNLGPVELVISYYFKLIDPTSKEELPNQQFPSSLLIWLSRSNSICPSLCFPFAEPSHDFWSYFESIAPFFPFKFDKKWLRLGQSNKKGTANMFSKM